MKKNKFVLSIISIISAFLIIAVQVITVIPVMADTVAQPIKVITDDFEHDNALKFYTDATSPNSVVPTVETEADGNKALKIVQTSNKDVKTMFWVQDANGNPYQIPGKNGIMQSGVSYKYIMEFRYKIELGHETTALFIKSARAFSDGNRVAQQVSSAVLGSGKYNDPSTIGLWGCYQPSVDNEWHTISIPAVFTGTNGWQSLGFQIETGAVSNAVVWIDDVTFYSVDENEDLGTVLYKTDGGNAISAQTWVVGADYTLPTPVKENEKFGGWYLDGEFTEKYDGKFPANTGGQVYSTAYALWGEPGALEKVVSDSMEYTSERIYGADNTVTTAGITTGVGANGSSALKVENTAAAAFNLIPRNKSGNAYTADLTAGEAYNYFIQFKYKLESGNTEDYLRFSGLAVGEADKASVLMTDKTVAVKKDAVLSELASGAAIPGLGDGEWHTASLPVTFKPDTDSRVTLGIYCNTASADVFYIDDVVIYKVQSGKKLGTVLFETNGAKTVTEPISSVVGNTYYMDVPQKDGYVFAGWYSDEAYTAPYDGVFPENTVDFTESNTVYEKAYTKLYAKWNAIETITKIVEDDLEHVAERYYAVNNVNTQAITENGLGTDGSVGAKVTNLASAKTCIVPKNIGGTTYTFDIESNQTYKFILNFKYKVTSGHDQYNSVAFKAAIVDMKNNSYESNIGKAMFVKPGSDPGVVGAFNSIQGAYGDEWHTASLTVDFKAAKKYSDMAVGLFIETTMPDELYFDDFEVYMVAPEKNIATMLFNTSVSVDAISWVSGEEFTLPNINNENYAVYNWYTDSGWTTPYTSTTFPEEDFTTVYGEVLTKNGFYAEEHFDNNEAIWQKVTPSYQWDLYGLKGKMRNFTFSEDVFHDSDGSGRSLKYDRDGLNGAETYSVILLTNNIDNQIYLGSKEDETPCNISCKLLC